MREIKFRGWSNRRKIMFYLAESMSDDTHLEMNNHAWGVFEEGDHGAVCNKLFGDVLMQYTGLKDKNGKEIYEGDLVKCNSCPEYTYKVEWNEDYGYGLFCEGVGFNAENVEVIGNIYENPELLEGEK